MRFGATFRLQVSVEFNDFAGLLITGEAAHKRPCERRHRWLGRVKHVVDCDEAHVIFAIYVFHVNDVVVHTIDNLK